jgi:acyl-CoA thioesterase-1
MKKNVFFAIIFIVAACTSTPKLSPLSPDAVVLAFGDSITHGTGAEPGQSYPAVLSSLISRPVVEAGIPGEISSEGLLRLPQFLDDYKPALLILCHGGNDMLRRMGDEQAAGNIREMIRLARDRNIKVVLIGVPKLSITLSTAKFYKKIADEFSIPYDGNILNKILKDNSLKADEIHPNARGYRMLAESVAELLRKSGAI